MEVQCVSIFQCGPVPFLFFVVCTALVTVCMCISAASKETKNLMDTLPHEPERIDFLFFVEHLSKQRRVVLRQYNILVSFLAKVLSCPKTTNLSESLGS